MRRSRLPGKCRTRMLTCERICSPRRTFLFKSSSSERTTPAGTPPRSKRTQRATGSHRSSHARSLSIATAVQAPPFSSKIRCSSRPPAVDTASERVTRYFQSRLCSPTPPVSSDRLARVLGACCRVFRATAHTSRPGMRRLDWSRRTTSRSKPTSRPSAREKAVPARASWTSMRPRSGHTRMASGDRFISASPSRPSPSPRNSTKTTPPTNAVFRCRAGGSARRSPMLLAPTNDATVVATACTPTAPRSNTTPSLRLL
mmetsp:Transcript_9713/g.23978  ORF Transcript_9713/g.23978 Transcript_9713/m.23978 type:complete len:258 (+) Transcript_9713:629-1402(+)